jgi:hypothetical protein
VLQRLLFQVQDQSPCQLPGEENANCQRKSCCDSTENVITRDKVENEKASTADNSNNQDREIGWIMKIDYPHESRKI